MSFVQRTGRRTMTAIAASLRLTPTGRDLASGHGCRVRTLGSRTQSGHSSRPGRQGRQFETKTQRSSGPQRRPFLGGDRLRARYWRRGCPRAVRPGVNESEALAGHDPEGLDLVGHEAERQPRDVTAPQRFGPVGLGLSATSALPTTLTTEHRWIRILQSRQGSWSHCLGASDSRFPFERACQCGRLTLTRWYQPGTHRQEEWSRGGRIDRDDLVADEPRTVAKQRFTVR
jgi:hypothetical protein